VEWRGGGRECPAAGGAVLRTFALALLIVFLVLAAQFESFIHPLVIMLTVPLGVLGALIGLWLTGGTLNLFSQIGIVMLVGLAAKNGILTVGFAHRLRDRSRSRHQAPGALTAPFRSAGLCPPRARRPSLVNPGTRRGAIRSRPR